MHALLTPGTHVLRRSPGIVQVGLGPAPTVRLPVPTDPDEWDPADRSAWRDVPAPVLARLSAAGLAARDDRSLREALPGQDTRTDEEHRRWQRHSVAALFRTDPEAMATAVGRRRRCEVTVRTFGHALGASLAADLTELCRRTGLPLAVDRAPGPPRKGAAEPRPVSVVVGLGEPRRELLDPLVRDGVAHLLVRMVEQLPPGLAETHDDRRRARGRRRAGARCDGTAR